MPHIHQKNAIISFDELAERSLMSPLAGTKHTYARLAIVKFSHFIHNKFAEVIPLYNIAVASACGTVFPVLIVAGCCYLSKKQT